MLAITRRGLLCGVAMLVLAGLLAGSTAIKAEETADGLALFTGQKCNMCHSVPQADVTAKMKSAKMKGPDLPAAPREPDWIASYLKREVQIDGKDHKKEFKGNDEELKALAAWLVALKDSE